MYIYLATKGKINMDSGAHNFKSIRHRKIAHKFGITIIVSI